MATEERSGGGGSGWLAFVVGALLIVVLGIGYMMYSGKTPQTADNSDVNINVRTPDLPKLPTPEVPSTPPSNMPTQQAPGQ